MKATSIQADLTTVEVRSEAKIRVLLVDDHPVVRKGVRRMLEQAADLFVVGEAGSGAEALEMAQTHAPDVILLDMEMPGMNGSEVARALKAGGSTVHILVLTAHDDSTYIHELFSLGIDGYLLKEEAAEQILEAVRGAARGEQGWVSRQIASQLATSMREKAKGAPHSLTPREMDVLRAVVNGHTNQEIGYELSVSEKTVEKHLFSIMNKLKVSSRVEAAVMAVREKWV